MPPKAAKTAPSKKADAKKKEKIIEDKTFGLKNKKGAKNQKFIQQIEKQVKSGGVPARKAGEPDKNKKKEDKLKELKELNQLFKPVQKVDKNADPKTVVCAFFKHGQCAKGNKCKFSHDLTMERKAEKRSLYFDGEKDGEDKGEDSMDTWDEAKLKEVVEKKHGDSKAPTTTIICKFFLEAVERSKYGWFWACPNGPACIYRHALPPGFVLKKDKKKDEKKEEISLEDLIEREREALASKHFTKVTLETFLAWKKRKLKEKKDTIQKNEDKKRLDFKAGKASGLSGRDMFMFNPELIGGDDCEDGDVAYDSYQREEDDSEVKYHEIDLDNVELEDVDDSGTQAPVDRLKHQEEDSPSSDTEGAAAAVPIDENLFLEDDDNSEDDDDLDNIDEELKDLGIE